MLTLNDPIGKDNLKVLFNTSQNRLQRHKIRDELYPKYEKKGYDSKRSFDVVLQRRLDHLCILGLLEKEYVERNVFYSISDEAKNKVEKMLLQDDIYDLTGSFDTKWLRILRSLLDNMRREGTDPEEFFNRYCLAFVGGIPYTFEKSKDGMKEVLLRERRLADLAAKYGVTKEEYFREMVKYVTNQPKGIRRILAYLVCMGLTEEDIKKLLEKQGGTWKVTRYTRKKG